MYLYTWKPHVWSITVYSGQKKKVNDPEGSKYFFPVERGKYNLGKKYYLTIIGKI